MPVQARDLSEAEVVEYAAQFEMPAVLPDREIELADYFQCAVV